MQLLLWCTAVSVVDVMWCTCAFDNATRTGSEINANIYVQSAVLVGKNLRNVTVISNLNF